jgi:hypothetical protein
VRFAEVALPVAWAVVVVPELVVAPVAVVVPVDDDAELGRPLPLGRLDEPLVRVAAEPAPGRAVELPEVLVEGVDDEPFDAFGEESRDGALWVVACDARLVEPPDGAPSLEAEGFVAVPPVAVLEPVPDLGAPDDGALVAGAGVVVESDAAGVDEGALSLFASRPVPLPAQLVSTVAAASSVAARAAASAVVLAAVGFAPAGPSPAQSA